MSNMTIGKLKSLLSAFTDDTVVWVGQGEGVRVPEVNTYYPENDAYNLQVVIDPVKKQIPISLTESGGYYWVIRLDTDTYIGGVKADSFEEAETRAKDLLNDKT